MSCSDDLRPEDLPDLLQSELAADGLDAFLNALDDDADILAVQLKGAPTAHSDGQAMNLAAARHALHHGQARACQIHYAYQGMPWVDTVMATRAGWRVIRMKALQQAP